MRRTPLFVALAALAAAACEDSTPVPIGPDGELAISGTYAASPGEGGEFGAILFRVAPTDAGPLAVPLVVLVALFALASLSPSIRAVRTDPCETLRCE